MTGSAKDEPTLELLGAWRSGDEEAFGRLFERFRTRLVSHIRRKAEHAIGPDSDIEDILQETLLAAWKRLPEFEYRFRGSLVAWLCILSDGVIGDRRKYAQAKGRNLTAAMSELSADAPTVTPEATYSTPSRSAMHSDDASRLAELIERLPDTERIAVRAKFFENKPIREIAVDLGLSKSEAQRRLESGVDRLMKWF